MSDSFCLAIIAGIIMIKETVRRRPSDLGKKIMANNTNRAGMGIAVGLLLGILLTFVFKKLAVGLVVGLIIAFLLFASTREK